MSEDLAKKAENENSDNNPEAGYRMQASEKFQDGGFLASLACAGSFMMLCNAFETDLKILGAVFTAPGIFIGAYDACKYYAGRKK